MPIAKSLTGDSLDESAPFRKFVFKIEQFLGRDSDSRKPSSGANILLFEFLVSMTLFIPSNSIYSFLPVPRYATCMRLVQAVQAWTPASQVLISDWIFSKKKREYFYGIARDLVCRANKITWLMIAYYQLHLRISGLIRIFVWSVVSIPFWTLRIKFFNFDHSLNSTRLVTLWRSRPAQALMMGNSG